MAATTVVPTLVRMILNSPTLTTAQIERVLDFTPSVTGNDVDHQNCLINLLAGGLNRTWPQSNALSIGATCASQTLTVTSTGPVADETFAVAGVTFTAKASGATGNQFNINASPTIVAANIAAAVNASASCATLVTATSALGVVTFTAVVPGLVSNFTPLTESMTNTSVGGATFAGGLEGDLFSISML